VVLGVALWNDSCLDEVPLDVLVYFEQICHDDPGGMERRDGLERTCVRGIIVHMQSLNLFKSKILSMMK